ncbi:MAG: tetratricopeptide repeat protein [Bacteroidetes bacterium]|nr:tetratricopeptide repeat protein [Bacteroidota bacterium]
MQRFMYTFIGLTLLLLVCGSPTIVHAQNGEDEETERLLRRNWSLFLEYFKTNDFNAAKKAGWKILELNPARFTTFHPRMIELYDSLVTRAEDEEVKAGAADTLIWLIDSAIEHFPDRKNDYLLTKGYQLERHFPDLEMEAIDAYESGIEGDYTTADMYYLSRLAILYSKNPEMKQQAIQVLQAILLREPNNEMAQSMLKNLMDNPEEYISILRDAHYADPGNVTKLFELANGYYELVQQFDSSAVYFGKLTGMSPEVINYWQRYGASLMFIEDYRAASEAYKKVTELDPESRDAWMNLARSVLQAGKLSEARTYAEKASALDPSWGAPHMVVANAYETAVSRCVEGTRGGWANMKVIDKLVYLLAQNEYARAARDPQFEGQARDRSRALSTLIPSSEDLFLNKIPRGTPYLINKDCYGWINRSVTP